MQKEITSQILYLNLIAGRNIERNLKNSEPTTAVGDTAQAETTPVDTALAEDKTKDVRRKRKKKRPIGGVKDKLPVEAGYE